MYKIKYLNKILRTVDNPCGHHLKYIIFKKYNCFSPLLLLPNSHDFTFFCETQNKFSQNVGN